MTQSIDTFSSFDKLPPWDGRAILLVDLDAFFASVEQLDHPEWRGKPVIVGGDRDKRGVVSTCSYEARAFGVRSAMASAVAARLCPDAIWTHGNFKRYNEVSAHVMDILLAESPLLQQVSIDEAFLDVSPGRFSKEHPVAIAGRIRKRVEALGVTCSVGVGTSKTVAKIASDMDKPNGITAVFPGTEASFLAPLPVRALSGIGKQTASRLKKMGVSTLGEVAVLDNAAAKALFGVNANSMRERCRGIDPVEVETEREVKSVSNEMTFSSDISRSAEVEQCVRMLAAKVGRRLRRKGLAGHTVALKAKYEDRSIKTARQALPCSTDDENVFVPALMELVPKLWSPGVHLRLLGVAISGFSERSEQLGLFDGLGPEGADAGSPPNAQTATAMPKTTKPAAASKLQKKAVGTRDRRKLIEATDKVKNRFGDDAVAYGRDLRFKDLGTGTAPQKKDEYN